MSHERYRQRADEAFQKRSAVVRQLRQQEEEAEVARTLRPSAHTLHLPGTGRPDWNSDAEIKPALKRMVCGAARTLLESGLTPAEVMDLIPVKPLAEMEPQVGEMYRNRLPALFQKIKP